MNIRFDKSLNNGCKSNATMCGYEEDGVVYACSTGCCQNQCNGQCPEDSNGIPMKIGTRISPMDVTNKWTLSIIILFITLLLLSTVGMF